jgi:predicted nucleotidyltransferase
MEQINNKIPIHARNFFQTLGNYLDNKLYFFGSIQRPDYFPSASDIDVAIYTENVDSTISKLQNFLNMKRNQFKKFVWRLNCNNKLVEGFKVMYKDPEYNFLTEISIYNEKYKDGVIYEHINKTVLPFYCNWILIILKYLFYSLKWISSESYVYWKKFILTTMINKPEDKFLVIDPK